MKQPGDRAQGFDFRPTIHPRPRQFQRHLVTTCHKESPVTGRHSAGLTSGEDVLDDVGLFDSRNLLVESLVAVGEPVVVDSQQVKDRGV